VVEAGVAPGKASREVSWVRAQAASYPSDGMVLGVRCNLQDEPPGFLRDHALRAGVRRLGECGLPFDACVRSWQLTELEELAAACPDTVIVLDHAGKPRCGAGVASWLIALLAPARHPNVRCKLSGLATEAAPCARPLHARLRVTTVYVTHDQVEAMTLGQRVCVLRDGRLQQVDSPQTLFTAPVNLFVAGFIGSPAMNFATARLVRDDGPAVTFAGYKLPVPAALLAGRPALDRYFDRDLILGERRAHAGQRRPGRCGRQPARRPPRPAMTVTWIWCARPWT
jgi:hypothetical protein